MASQFWAFGATLSFGTRDTCGAAKKKSTFFSIFVFKVFKRLYSSAFDFTLVAK